ncbi:TPA: hypothetical protein NJ005_005168 [Vibrio parahaemolyticus]|nr:hypothetical protein [Vibrio parahaemolyticus]HCG5512106.1 hypothetical protein [Vibrio parahaemolyticus]
MFLHQTAEKLGIEIQNLDIHQQQVLLAETFREINRAVLKAVVLNSDRESLESLDLGCVRLVVSNKLKLLKRYKEQHIREMLAEISDSKLPDYDSDLLQVGCIPYYNYLIFWHIIAYQSRRAISFYKLPACNYSKIEFRVIVSAELHMERR